MIIVTAARREMTVVLCAGRRGMARPIPLVRTRDRRRDVSRSGFTARFPVDECRSLAPTTSTHFAVSSSRRVRRSVARSVRRSVARSPIVHGRSVCGATTASTATTQFSFGSSPLKPPPTAACTGALTRAHLSR